MKREDKRVVLIGLLRFISIGCLAAGIIILSSGDAAWMGPWVVLGFDVLYGIMLITLGMKYFPATIVARAKTKFKYSWDKAAIIVYAVSYYSQYIVGGLDHRFGWSAIPLPWRIAGIVLYAGSLAITLWAIAVNPFAQGSVEYQKERNQKVVMNGPYRFFRHPMYFSSILFTLGIPLILGSLWAFIASPVVIGAFVFRCYHEDRLLLRELKGYRDYAKKVKFRMIPFIW